MSRSLNIASLYRGHHRELGLRWLAGEQHAARALAVSGEEAGPTYVGHMNLLRPYLVQVLGTTEWEHLYTLGEAEQEADVERLLATHPACVIVADGIDCPAPLLVRARERGIPLLWAAASSNRVITDLQHDVSQGLARRQSMHGVFMEVLGVGVLLTGRPGVGKSELALELVSRGHRLVADDAPDLCRVAPDTIEGSCPHALRDFMEVRGLGIINVRAQFGDSAVKERRPLRLIIRLQEMSDGEITPEQRLQGIRRSREVLGVEVPEVTLPVAPGHNLAVLVECSVRNHLLLAKGYDAAADFMQRQLEETSRTAAASAEDGDA